MSFVDDARKRFVAESAYLDDRPGVPLRFLGEANLTQIIRRQEAQVDSEDVRASLRDKIREIFKGTGATVFNLVAFPGGAYEVPDEIGDNRPLLVVIGYDAVSIPAVVDTVPHLVERIYKHKGADDRAVRGNRNALVMVTADEARKDEMRHCMVRRLALRELKKAERIGELAEHQQAKVRELESKSETEVAVSIQQCYRHVFYPSRADRATADLDLGHTAIDVPSASASPGVGQRQVERTLRDLRKLRTTEDEPDSPAYIRDRTPLKKGEITTRALREEFRRDPGLPMLVGDDVFVRGIRRGIEQGEFVYRSGGLLYGPGDPHAAIAVDEQSFVFTMGFARERGIWPRPAPATESTPAAAGARLTDGSGGEAPVAPGHGRAIDGSHSAPAADALFAEGVLKEALARLWERVRARKLDRVDAVRIRMFDAGDAFKLLGVIGTVQGASKVVTLEGEYETTESGVFQFKFEGPATDAQVVREFLEPQLRAAPEKTLTAEFELRMETGLAMTGDAPERLTERLARHVAGAAHVTASIDAAAAPSRVAT